MDISWNVERHVYRAVAMRFMPCCIFTARLVFWMPTIGFAMEKSKVRINYGFSSQRRPAFKLRAINNSPRRRSYEAPSMQYACPGRRIGRKRKEPQRHAFSLETATVRLR